MLDLGADPSQAGWMKIGEMMRFGSPLELIFQMKSESNHLQKNTIENLQSFFMERNERRQMGQTNDGDFF